MKKKKKHLSKLIRIIACLIFILAVNIISSFVFDRLDLTSEKRYTLSPTTKELLKNIDDYVYFKVALTGSDLPVSFQRLKNETKEMLDEFAAHSKYIEYVFIDPAASDDPEEVAAAYQELYDKGLVATDLQVKKSNGSMRKIIFPGAIATYKDREIAIQLLQTQMGVPSEEVLNNSIQSLEYSLSNAIRKLVTIHKSEIAIIEGHGELNKNYMIAFEAMLREYYSVSYVTINGQLNSLADIKGKGEDSVKIVNKYKAIIIPGPKQPFSEKDKFVIDQYIMRGGKVLWLVEPVYASMDSLQNSPTTMSYAIDHNLQDQLFNYGIRIEPQLIMDLQCLSIPLSTGSVGGRPQIDFFPWYYFPVITPTGDHPIVKNLNAIKTEFISPVTPLEIPNVKATVLLTSSPFSKLFMTPDVISLDILRNKPSPSLFTKSEIPVAVLLEGEFNSLYDGRIPYEVQNNSLIGFKSESSPTAMVVISDVDIIKNQFRSSDGTPLNLGYDQYTQNQFGNPELMLNIMNYLCDDSKLISVRSRELKIRLLDSAKIHNNSIKIQILNMIIPSVLIIIGGIIYWFIRKRKYSKK